MKGLWLGVLGLIACGPPQPGAGAPPHDDVEEAPSQTVSASVPRAAPAPLPTGEAAVAYQVDLSQAPQHLVHVSASTASAGQDTLTWMMPVWTPGSYLVREYARQVEGVRATGADGQELPVRKVAKNRWEVATKGSEQVQLDYTVYARERSVRTNEVTADAAVLVGAALFLVPLGAMDAPLELTVGRLDEASGWATGLDAHPDGAPGHYLARDFDELVDSPVLVGSVHRYPFEVGGVPHALVNLGVEDDWDGERASEDLARLVGETIALWGELPYDHYVFLNVLGGGRGGLEHLDNTLMMTATDQMASEGRYKDWLGLASHEFFHTWNVKRLRPVGLGPFDYEQETRVPSLWIAEGWTSYYDDLLLARTELISAEEHLSRLSGAIAAFQTRPSRHVQSLADASQDAWIKYYRGDENSVNTSTSYYRKGALVAWLLDAKIREATGGTRSLDDALRLAWSRHRAEGYTEAQMRAVLSEVAGEDLSTWLAAAVDRPGELDYGPALRWFGLRFAEVDEADPTPWLGLPSGGRVATVSRGTPAWEAGVNVGDELVGFGGRRVDHNLNRLLEATEVGEEVELLVARDGRLRTLTATVGAEPRQDWTLEVDPASTTRQQRAREAWNGVRTRP